jgi:hypothetical protein
MRGLYLLTDSLGSKVWGFALRATTTQAGFTVQRLKINGNSAKIVPYFRSNIKGKVCDLTYFGIEGKLYVICSITYRINQE